MFNPTNPLTLQRAFDSWTDSSPEVRGEKCTDRHLIYEGGGIVIDLLLKCGSNKRLHIGGQLLPLNDVLDEAANAPVTLQSGPTQVSTTTNSLGEFSFTEASSGTLNLDITFKGRRFSVHGLSHNSEPRNLRVVQSIA